MGSHLFWDMNRVALDFGGLSARQGMLSVQWHDARLCKESSCNKSELTAVAHAPPTISVKYQRSYQMASMRCQFLTC